MNSAFRGPVVTVGRALAMATLIVGSALALAPSALAEDDAGKGKSVTFGADADAEPAVAAGDYQGMLAVCDARLEACKDDEVGIPFLGAAYLALWAILIVFLVAVRRGQGRLEAEAGELRARLRELEDAA